MISLENPTRRKFFTQGGNLLGGLALGSLLNRPALSSAAGAGPASDGGIPLQFPAKAKRIIYLHMVGGPPQMDLFDYKPEMKKWYNKDLPESVINGQRLTGMTSNQARFPIAPSVYNFAQRGESGMWMNSDLLPWMGKCADDICLVRSMHTEAINHEPAITAMQTGNQVAGGPCLGSWASYGLGAANENLPAFVVLVARNILRYQIQAISGKLWSSGYLPGKHAGVSFRNSGDPILYINNPAGVSSSLRRKMLDGLKEMNEFQLNQTPDPDTVTRIQQYEMAFRMQSSVPNLVDLKDEKESTFSLYGEEARESGTFANTLLMSRRLIEKGVRFVQVYKNSWDTHADVTGRLPNLCKEMDQPCYALIQDLKQRGLLDDTLVIWGGEFGRTIYSQGGLTATNYGRDHHPRCFSMWMAGGGIKGGTVYGETDDFSYNIVKNPVHIRDLHATILHQLGYDHEKFSFPYQGLNQKLTGVEPAKVIHDLLA